MEPYDDPQQDDRETEQAQPVNEPPAADLPAEPAQPVIESAEAADSPAEPTQPVNESAEAAEVPINMAVTQVSLPTQLLPAAPPEMPPEEADKAEAESPAEQPELVRVPTGVPAMEAAESPEYPIQQAEPVSKDEDTNEVVMPRYSPLEERIRALTAAINRYPEAPVNYVLRAELILDLGEREMARNDFRRGLMLAESQGDSADWGYVNRALADRARAGLRRCG